MFTRALGALVASAALTAAALPAQAVEKPVTVGDRLEQIALVDTAVPVEQSPLDPVRADGTVTLRGAGSSGISLGLPVAELSGVSRTDGRYMVPASDGASLAVAPTADGAQILVGIEDRDAPAAYDFALDAPAGFAPQITPDGGIEIGNDTGEIAAQVAAPWAVDAEGRQVPTRFTLRGSTITQVVDHGAGDFTYPIVADPKVKFCDWGTAVCVKLTKKETRRGAKGLSGTLKDAIAAVCGLIPASSIPGAAALVVCAAAVSAYFAYLRGKFRKATKAGKCIELKFRIVGPPVVTAKVVKC